MRWLLVYATAVGRPGRNDHAGAATDFARQTRDDKSRRTELLTETTMRLRTLIYSKRSEDLCSGSCRSPLLPSRWPASRSSLKNVAASVLEIGLPNGSTPQLRILDGGTGTVDMPKVGKFGFVPTLKDGTVSVEVFDMNQTPHRQIDRVEAAVGGDAVQLNTKAQLSIRVLRLVAH